MAVVADFHCDVVSCEPAWQEVRSPARVGRGRSDLDPVDRGQFFF